MRFIGRILLSLFLLIHGYNFAQTPDSTKSSVIDTTTVKSQPQEYPIPVNKEEFPVKSTSAEKDTSAFNFFFSEEEELKFLYYKPVMFLGCGVLSFFGEGISDPKTHPVLGRFGFNLGVAKNISEYVTVGMSAVIGKLSGTNKSPEKNYNFQSDIFCGGATVTYNFGQLLKKEGYMIALNKQYEVLPFVAIGFEAVNFNSKGDLKDKNGKIYNYWSDGTIRDVAENSKYAGSSVILQRDYKYESDLRELNLDKQGKYSETSLAIPLTIGADFIVHDRVTLRVSTSLHYSLTDNIDNISSKGTGIRKGNSGKDAFMYSNVSFLFDIFSSEKIVNFDKFAADNPNLSDFDKVYYADEDKDGVNDFDDICIATPLGVQVYKNGCPFDCDGDGIPDYLDKEYNTPPGTVVDLNGDPFSESMMNTLAADSAKKGIEFEQALRYYPSIFSTVKTFESFADEIPKQYKYIDANEDGFVALDEFYNELDRFFDGKSKFTLEQIYDLMDFFFAQEK